MPFNSASDAFQLHPDVRSYGTTLEAARRRRARAETGALRRERRAELDRLRAEFDSLARVREEQEALIAKLSDSAA